MIVNISPNSDFSIHNIPFGIFSTKGTAPRVGVAIGDHILDLAAVADLGVFNFDTTVFRKPYLNDFIALGKSITSKVRTDIQSWLQDDRSPLAAKDGLFFKQSEAAMHLPVKVGDYTDFYSSLEHASNAGRMFGDPNNPLFPNWKHMPVGYHGRASSIMVSGKPVHRPKGQVLPKGEKQPVFQAADKLDFELEMVFIVGKETEIGSSISTTDASEYIFGMVLFNDWSARDIQLWEFVPLGPFLSKNFASSISPWVVTMEALEPFRVESPKQDPPVLPYLQCHGKNNYDIALEVNITPQNGEEQTLCRSNFKYMYWNMAQQLAHHTVNGCNVKVGDIMGSGTISGESADSFGSMLELSWAGTKPIAINDGTTRIFIEDYDTITMRGYAEQNGVRVGFGEVTGQVLPCSP